MAGLNGESADSCSGVLTMIIMMMMIVKEKGCCVCVCAQDVEALKVDLSKWNHRATDLQKSTSQIKSANLKTLV